MIFRGGGGGGGGSGPSGSANENASKSSLIWSILFEIRAAVELADNI